jgi:hypothetical protein
MSTVASVPSPICSFTMHIPSSKSRVKKTFKAKKTLSIGNLMIMVVATETNVGGVAMGGGVQRARWL